MRVSAGILADYQSSLARVVTRGAAARHSPEWNDPTTTKNLLRVVLESAIRSENIPPKVAKSREASERTRAGPLALSSRYPRSPVRAGYRPVRHTRPRTFRIGTGHRASMAIPMPNAWAISAINGKSSSPSYICERNVPGRCRSRCEWSRRTRMVDASKRARSRGRPPSLNGLVGAENRGIAMPDCQNGSRSVAL